MTLQSAKPSITTRREREESRFTIAQRVILLGEERERGKGRSQVSETSKENSPAVHYRKEQGLRKVKQLAGNRQRGHRPDVFRLF